MKKCSRCKKEIKWLDYSEEKEGKIICGDCSHELDGKHCLKCKRRFSILDGIKKVEGKKICTLCEQKKHSKASESTKIPTEQQSDAITAMVLSAIVLGVLYYFFFKSLFDFFRISLTIQVVILVVAWGSISGSLIGQFAHQKAMLKMAYQK